MALIVTIVVWENITGLVRGAKFWESWENTKYPERRTDETMRPEEAGIVDVEKIQGGHVPV